VALSVAIIVSGRYSIDAVNRLVTVQFENIQRDDATVLFQEPRPARAAHDLASLPGVLQVEPFREIPVRLRFGYRSRRVAVMGLGAQSDLRRPVDQQLNPIHVPPNGLVLNKKLAEILRVNPGDVVTMEVLEGARPVRNIVVAGLIDEPVGLGVYMDAAALHRLMREGDTLSGARLKVDANVASRLYSALKRTPSISGVSIREAMLASFWKAFGESIWISTAFLVGFACVIAFGIVYNGFRIVLSERGHELACLRVLGYTSAEVWKILMSEQGLLVIVAIPVGSLIGFGLSALLARFFSRDLFRLPLVVNSGTYAFSAIVVAAAAIFSGIAAAGRIRRMKLTEVLKSRE
jgi:putative ABC transport system permease protein